MHAVDERDRVVPLDELPQSSPGAPCPLVVQDEFTTVVAYYVHASEPGWTGETVRIVDPESSDGPAALVRFRGACAGMFGPPNDEAFHGHPLAGRGASPVLRGREPRLVLDPHFGTHELRASPRASSRSASP